MKNTNETSSLDMWFLSLQELLVERGLTPKQVEIVVTSISVVNARFISPRVDGTKESTNSGSEESKTIVLNFGNSSIEFSDQGMNIVSPDIKHNGVSIGGSHTHRNVAAGSSSTSRPTSGSLGRTI